MKGFNVLVLEMIDRSLDKNGVAIQHPTDFEIMKIVWEDWLTRSGAEKVEIHKAVVNKEKGFELLKSFIENL